MVEDFQAPQSLQSKVRSGYASGSNYRPWGGDCMMGFSCSPSFVYLRPLSHLQPGVCVGQRTCIDDRKDFPSGVGLLQCFLKVLSRGPMASFVLLAHHRVAFSAFRLQICAFWEVGNREGVPSPCSGGIS